MTETPPARADDSGSQPDEGRTNALGLTFGLLGDEWTLLLLRLAHQGARRYSEFSAALPISYAVLTSRLEVLVQEGLLERRVYQQKPVRAEYVLTPKGLGIWPLLVAIWSWEKTWVPYHAIAVPAMRHQPCGETFTPLYCCRACSRPVGAPDLEATWGPSGGWKRSVPATRTRRRSTRRGRAQHTYYPETMAVFGNRWSSALVGAAFMGVHRFTEFQEKLGAPPSLLADRLSSLCEHEIFHRLSLEGREDWAEYRLTPKGMAFFPIIGTSLDWGETWYSEPGAPVLNWVHEECGQEFRGRLTCNSCARELTRAHIIVEDEDQDEE